MLSATLRYCLRSRSLRLPNILVRRLVAMNARPLCGPVMACRATEIPNVLVDSGGVAAAKCNGGGAATALTKPWILPLCRPAPAVPARAAIAALAIFGRGRFLPSEKRWDPR